MSNLTTTAHQRERTGLKYLAATFGVLIVAVVLNIWQPLWLAEPWLRLTPLLYCLLLQAWLPLLILSLNYSPRRRPALSTLLLLAFAAFQCLCTLTLPAPDVFYLTIEGIMGLKEASSVSNDFVCQPPTVASFTCELCIRSSDSSGLSRKTYTFRRLDPLPLLYLAEHDQTNSSQEPGLSCPTGFE